MLRRLAETRGDFAQAARMQDFESRKPVLARQIRDAMKNGELQLAKQLCDELNSLSMLTFDPTDPNGSPGEWDVRNKISSEMFLSFYSYFIPSLLLHYNGRWRSGTGSKGKESME